MNIFSQIKNIQNFSDNEKIVAEYILKHPQEVVSFNATTLAKKCFVSQATIYRLCEKLNCNGLSDLKVKISSGLYDYLNERNDFDFNFPVKKSQSHYEIMNYLKEDYEQTIQATLNLFDLEQLRQVVHAIKKAKCIDVYTSAGNIYFAQNFMFQMKELGIQVNVPTEDYHQKLQASISDKDHLAIIISFGGRGILVKNILKTLKSTKTPTLLISSVNFEHKDIDVDYHLYLNSAESHYYKISSFSTRLSILYVLDVIYACYFELDYEENLKKKLNYYALLSDTNENKS